MENLRQQTNSLLFAGMDETQMQAVFGCIGYHIRHYSKGQVVAFEQEIIHHVGIVLSGAVDMIKEDLWGNSAMLVYRGQYLLEGSSKTYPIGRETVNAWVYAPVS